MSVIARMWLAILALVLSPHAWAEPIRIVAASSLTEAMTEATQGHRVRLSFGGSGRIATQVLGGAPADIIAIAHPQWVPDLRAAGRVEESVRLLGNRLVVVTQAGHVPTVTNLSTLHNADRIAIASEGTPAGQYAREALQSLGLHTELQAKLINSTDVRSVLAQVASGAVDAGFVYQTDAGIDPALETRFMVDPALHSPIVIPFLLTPRGSENPEATALFQFIVSEEGQRMFHERGFVEATDVSHTRTPPTQKRDWSAAPIGLSLWVGIISVVLSLIPALGLGWVLARREFRFKSVLSTVCLAPLVLPPVVTGWMLLQALTALGIPLAFTRWAAVLAAAVVGFPLLLILTRQAIESVDTRYPLLAETLGLTPFQAFRQVTLPMALPGIAAGCVLAFARAMGEFGATAMLAGDQPGETRTLALAVYGLTEQPGGTPAAAILVGWSIVITLVALAAYERLVWRQRQLTGERT